MISTAHLERSRETLLASLNALQKTQAGSIEFEVYRNAVIKGFELTLEVCCKLLRKALKAYSGSPQAVDSLSYKNVFRHCAKHGLISLDLVERWFNYRDNGNNTAHDYGVDFAEQTLRLLPDFLKDVGTVLTLLKQRFGPESDA